MGGFEEREALFRRGAEALRAISDHTEEDLYACPLCRRLFAIAAIEGANPPLTREHVPPAKLGGRPLLLTCKSCNSSGGHALDAEAIARREFTQAMQALVAGIGTYEGKGVLHLGNERLAGDLIVRGKNVRFNVRPKATNPHAGPRARAQIREQQERGDDVQMTVRPGVRFRLRESLIGDLRSAYLIAFAAFGYSFAFHPRLESVREQILRSGEQVISLDFWTSDRSASVDSFSLFFLKTFEVLAVQLGLAWVFLPCPGSKPNAVEEVANRVGKDAVNAHELAWPERMEFVLDFEHEARRSAPKLRMVKEPSSS